jgi:hypothetical protein
MQIFLGSVATGVSESYVAGFPAIRTIVKAVYAQANAQLALADGAVLFAGTILLRLVALRADDLSGHGSPPRKLYLSMGGDGKARVRKGQ